MLLELQVGGVKAGPSGRPFARGDHTAAMVSQDAHGRYQEAVLNGRVFAAATASAGVAPGTALGTTGPFSLYNPASSGVYLSVIKVGMGYVSGTLGAGMVVAAANFASEGAAVTGTAITPVNLLVAGGGGAARAKPFTTSTLPAAPQSLYPIWYLNASLATTATNPIQLVEEVAGAIVIAPGGCLTLQGIAAAGTSPLVVFGAIWEELSGIAAL